MKIKHHELEVELLDEWWAEAGMSGFAPTTSAYRTHVGLCKGRETREILIDHIRPVRRADGLGIFNDSVEEGSARDRVVRILRGFRLEAMLPPVEIVDLGPELHHRYKLVNGTHRLYCSLAAGFTHVPTVVGFDIESLT